MKIYQLTYNLKRPGKDYSPISNVIATFPAYIYLMPGSWLIATEEQPSAVYNKIRPFLDPGDLILVIEVTTRYYGQLSPDVWQWIKKYLDV